MECVRMIDVSYVMKGLRKVYTCNFLLQCDFSGVMGRLLGIEWVEE